MEKTGNQTETFFSGLFQWDTIKVLHVILNSFIMVFGPILLGLAVWYEKKIADVVYRTLINQLLSYLFIFESIVCVVSRLGYFVNFCFGPNSALICDVNIFLGRLIYVFMITQITVRQFIKYMYIFNWKYIVKLDDNFMAFFLTLTNLMFSLLLCMYSFVLGFHNEELDFHICRDRHPLDNIADFLATVHLPMNKTTPLWLQFRWGTDPIAWFSFGALSVQILVAVQTW
jgi:hypothetical protein